MSAPNLGSTDNSFGATVLPFSFEPIEELRGGHCSRVYGNETRVLKVPFQGEELTFGWRASLLLQTCGGPQVFEHDASTGAVLMERINPGRALSLPEPEAREIFCGFVRTLQSLPTAGFPPLTIPSQLPWLAHSSPPRYP